MSKFVIKIGGSFLTKKALSGDFPATLDQIVTEGGKFIEKTRLESISREIREVMQNHRLMVVHGAGPFGHALVERILEGGSMDVPDVHESMLILNEAVRSALEENGIDSITLSPMNFVDYDGQFRTERLVFGMKTEAASGRVPISHGDIVRTVNGFGSLGEYEVISGDRVAMDLALGWHADSVIMVTDTDGILDQDPSIAEGKRIPRIGFQECLDLLMGRGAKGADVTGGIAQKVISCRGTINSGIPLRIISGLKRGNLLSASENADVGTTIEPG
jgi:isopentenyl phosphate kinase